MRQFSHRVLRCLAVVLCLTVLAAACGGDDDTDDGGTATTTSTTADGGEDPGGDPEPDGDEPQYGGSISVGLEADTNNWLPGSGSFASSGVTVAMAIYDPLVVQNADGEIEPNLAESLAPNDDLSEWTMTLRSGVQFHDGSPLDADTVKWNFDTLHDDEAANTFGAVQSAGIVEVEVVDELTLVWKLDGPNAGFPDVLRLAVGWPVSREAYESMGREEFGENPVGTGPFEFVEWSRDNRLIVRRNENYWRTDAAGNPLPYLDEVVFRPITDEQSRVQSIESDTVQVVSTLRGSSIKNLMALAESGDYAGNLHVGNVSGASIFNVLVAPVDDVRIRRALALASDADAVAAVLGDDGLVPATTQFLSPDSPWYSSNVAEVYPGADGRDVDAATELVEAYRDDPERSDGRAPGDPVEITYSCPGDPSLVEIGQLLQQIWGEVGVEVILEQVEQTTLISNAVGSAEQDPPWLGNYMVNCWRAGVESDPLTTFQAWFGPVASTPTNFTNFVHPDIDDALVDLRTNAEFADRYDAVERIGMVVAEEVPIAWGVGTATFVSWRGDIHGIATWRTPSNSEGSGTYDGRVILHQAWLEQ